MVGKCPFSRARNECCEACDRRRIHRIGLGNHLEKRQLDCLSESQRRWPFPAAVEPRRLTPLCFLQTTTRLHLGCTPCVIMMLRAAIPLVMRRRVICADLQMLLLSLCDSMPIRNLGGVPSDITRIVKFCSLRNVVVARLAENRRNGHPLFNNLHGWALRTAKRTGLRDDLQPSSISSERTSKTCLTWNDPGKKTTCI